MPLPFPLTLRGYCRVIHWPDFDIDASQEIGGLKERESDRGTTSQWSSQNTHNIYVLSSPSHTSVVPGTPKQITIITSKITDDRLVTNIIMLKKFEILQGFSKCDTEAQSKQTLLGKWCQESCLTQGYYKFSIGKKYSIGKACNRGKNNKMIKPII